MDFFVFEIYDFGFFMNFVFRHLDNRMIVGMLEKCCSSLGTSSCAEVDVKRENGVPLANGSQRVGHVQNHQSYNHLQHVSKNSLGSPVVIKQEAKDPSEVVQVRRETSGSGSPSVHDRRSVKSRKKSRTSRLVHFVV